MPDNSIKVSSLNELFEDLNKDVEFKKEYEAQKPYYDLLLAIVQAKAALDKVHDKLVEVL